MEMWSFWRGSGRSEIAGVDSLEFPVKILTFLDENFPFLPNHHLIVLNLL